MTRKRKTSRRIVGTGHGDNLVVFAGLTRGVLEWAKRSLSIDAPIPQARYVGAPAPPSDWRDLYKARNVQEIIQLIERECRSFMPNRIIVLYVPSRDFANLISSLDFVCFMSALRPNNCPPDESNPIGWRHDKSAVNGIVAEALANALKVTNKLKAEITDKRISPFTLPANNFYFPNNHSAIGEEYQELRRDLTQMDSLKENLQPSRFDRQRLPARAFKSLQNTDQFFQDSRGRVFPPDLYHAPSAILEGEASYTRLSLALRQRFRFGVTVRDGNLHYDVQYEIPRQLNREPMQCAMVGPVAVTGSHANIGVNDVIWVPSGRKEELS